MENQDRPAKKAQATDSADALEGEGCGSAERSAALAPDRVSDAPPSNRASERCGDDVFLVVWRGIDSLELSVAGSLSEDCANELARLKGLAQHGDPQKQASALLRLAGQVFQVQDRGARRYPYILQDSRFYIKVKGPRARFLPLVVAQIRSEYLTHRGVEQAVQDLLEIIKALGEIEGEAIVSRVDLAVDFVASFDMAGWDAAAWVTRAARKDAHTVGDAFSGWSIGLGGPLSARLYEKTLEIATRSKKVYLHELWKYAGWFPADVVWRFELQFRRQILAQFSLQTLGDVLGGLSGLWRYATSEWLRLTVPSNADGTRARWPLHPLWEQLSTVVWEGRDDPLTRTYKQGDAPSEKWLARAGTAVLTSMMACKGLADPKQGFAALERSVMQYWEEQEEWEGIQAEHLILDRALAKERKYGSHTLAQKLGLAPIGGPRNREPGEDDEAIAAAREYRRASRGGG